MSLVELNEHNKAALQFQRVWEEICKEIGFDFKDERFYENSFKVTVENEENEVVGICEICEYQDVKLQKMLNAYFQFSEIQEVQDNMEQIYVIEKLGVLKKYRGEGNLKRLWEKWVTHAGDNKPYAYIALINPFLFKVMKENYNLDIKPLVEIVVIDKMKCLPVIVSGASLHQIAQQKFF